MEKVYQYFPPDFINFILVTLFSLLIGLAQRKINLKREGETTIFGTDRTFTFIGILGFVLYILDPTDYVLFMGGGLVIGFLLAINYYAKQMKHNVYGVTSIVIALITYCLAPIVYTQPSWLYITLVVTVLLFTEMKSTLTDIAQRMNNDEIVTVAKFLAISGIILPMLPDKEIVEGISLTPYTIWFATVVVSGISYLSYILRKYVFRKSGILVSGFLGGLYSSTATISVLARKCRTAPKNELTEYISAMLIAVSMMFLRFLILIFIFNRSTFDISYPYLLVMSVSTMAVALYMHYRWEKKKIEVSNDSDESGNPLEFKVALIFAALFILFTALTHYTLAYAGNSGLNVLSFVSGFSDITPFILNLLSNEKVGDVIILQCSLQAMVANVLVNMLYAFFFSGRRSEMRRKLFASFSIIIFLNIIALLISYLLN